MEYRRIVETGVTPALGPFGGFRHPVASESIAG
jgi:hypothetical protein